MYHLRRKNVINSSDDVNCLDRHPVVGQQPPQHLSADVIESLFEIYKVDVQGGLPLNALFHNNPQRCYLVHTASASSKLRLLLSQFSIQGGLDTLQDHSTEHLTCHVQKHDATPVLTLAQIAFLWQFDQQTFLPPLWYLLFTPYLVTEMQNAIRRSKCELD